MSSWLSWFLNLKVQPMVEGKARWKRKMTDHSWLRLSSKGSSSDALERQHQVFHPDTCIAVQSIKLVQYRLA